MTFEWDDGLAGDTREERLLASLDRDGAERTLARLIDRLRLLSPPGRRGAVWRLALVPGPGALDAIEQLIDSPVVEIWGQTAALLGIRWPRIVDWLDRGRPLSLAALDALLAYRRPGAGSSALHRAIAPVLVDPPLPGELRLEVHACLARDSSPRVEKDVAEIVARADEICRGGPSLGITGRRFLELKAAEARATRHRWREAQRPLPPPPQLPHDQLLRNIWIRRWSVALEACGRRGGHVDPLLVDPPLPVAELAAIERALGRALPPTLTLLFTKVSSRVILRWFLDENDRPEGPLREIFSGGCDWDARALPALEEHRKGWVAEVFPDRNRAYDQVWHDKLCIQQVPNGDLIAIDVSRPDAAPVVYLSHDDGEGHGRVLGHSVIDFIDRWTLLGCPGPEDWQMVPFLRNDAPCLDPEGDNARAWRTWLGLQALAST